MKDYFEKAKELCLPNWGAEEAFWPDAHATLEKAKKELSLPNWAGGEEAFWSDAHAALVGIKNLIAVQKALGLLTNWTEAVLMAAEAALEREFKRHQPVEDPDIGF